MFDPIPFISVLDAEVSWCLRNPDTKRNSEEWEEGFIDGLNQARLLWIAFARTNNKQDSRESP